LAERVRRPTLHTTIFTTARKAQRREGSAAAERVVKIVVRLLRPC